MTNTRTIFVAGLCAATLILAGCGGETEESSTTTSPGPDTDTGTSSDTDTGTSTGTDSGGESGSEYRTLSETENPASSVAVLTAVTAQNGNVATDRITGTYDHAAATVTAEGVTASLESSDFDHVALINVAGGNNKIVAIPTREADMPTTGTAVAYNGTGVFQAIDVSNATNTISGTLDAVVTADFENSSVNLAFSGQTGSSTANATYTVNNLLIDGIGYTEQSSTTTSSTNVGTLADFTNETNVDVSGVFAGPDATETAATVAINASGVGQVLIDMVAGQ